MNIRNVFFCTCSQFFPYYFSRGTAMWNHFADFGASQPTSVNLGCQRFPPNWILCSNQVKIFPTTAFSIKDVHFSLDNPRKRSPENVNHGDWTTQVHPNNNKAILIGCLRAMKILFDSVSNGKSRCIRNIFKFILIPLHRCISHIEFTVIH